MNIKIKGKVNSNETPIIISIIMATYNRAHLITETLNSISNQTFPNWECLIIDDGSEDNTSSVFKRCTIKDSRFIYLPRSQNFKKGLPGCRNQGLELAKGEYIIFFDDDDIVHPENLQTCYNLLKGNDFQFCRYDKKPFWGSTGKVEFRPIKTPNFELFKFNDLDKMIMGKVPFASCCVMWNRACFRNIRFNENLMYAEEWECYSRILSKGFKGISIDDVLYFNRKHPNSNTGEFDKKDKIRLRSKITATKLIIKNLGEKNMLSIHLKDFFIQLGFQLKSREIINNVLHYSRVGFVDIIKYNLGFIAYPVLRPLFKLKGKFHSH